MHKKIKVGVLFGGRSVEHEVSLQSARNVVSSLDREKYSITLIGIDKEGDWQFYDENTFLINPTDPESIELGKKRGAIDFFELPHILDVVFPVLHGYLGEDGAVQGLLKVLGLPFVGADVLGSAIGMDKDVMKRLLTEAGIPVTKFLTLYKHERPLWPKERVVDLMTFPLFVKPSNGGSSIGMSKVKDVWELDNAINTAFQYDRKILLEEAVVGREIEFSLLGNENPRISLPCEIIPKGEFHSYSSKYIDREGAEFIVPVQLEPDVLLAMQRVALKGYRALGCEGMGRVDLFLKPDGEILFNELNTIPGLTDMSPYNKMWQASGLSDADMLDSLIQHALERHIKESTLVRGINLKEQWVKQ